MKKLLLLPCILFFITQISAQDKNIPAYKKSFVIKWSPASLYAGKIGVGMEINLSPKSSFTIVGGIPAEKNMTINVDNKDRVLTTKTYSIMAGYRFYLGKKALHGLYAEPYVKCLDNKTYSQTDFTIGDGSHAFMVSSTYHGAGVGAQLGFQCMIAKRVVVDWYFLGPELNSSCYEMVAQQTDESTAWDPATAADAQSQVSDFVKNIPLLGHKTTIETDAENRNIKARYEGLLPGFRFGVSLGVRF